MFKSFVINLFNKTGNKIIKTITSIFNPVIKYIKAKLKNAPAIIILILSTVGIKKLMSDYGIVLFIEKFSILFSKGSYVTAIAVFIISTLASLACIGD